MAARVFALLLLAGQPPHTGARTGGRIFSCEAIMQWAEPQYTKSQVDKAGEILISAEPISEENTVIYPSKWHDALETINNWRSCHNYPLQALKMTLRTRANRLDSNAIVAQRLKRLSSIAIKLRRNKNMALSQMQDTGGCRAVLDSVRHVDSLARVYEQSNAKNPHDRPEFVKKFDYVAKPKSDGYRSVHLIYKYRTRSPEHCVYNGLKIEIQLRSRLQHAWATAVETVDTFSKQALKIGGGNADWRRFFVLMGSAIALKERKPIVPGGPASKDELTAELGQVTKTLRVQSVLAGWSAAIEFLRKERTAGARVFLLYLDLDARSVKITGFSDKELAKASKEYLATEKMIEDRPSAQAVLVSVKSMRALRTAYPNYFADTRVFIDAVNRAIS